MRARFVVRGIVQGVNFRAVTAREATSRELTGRVWNRDDGCVEVIAEGAPQRLDELARWLEHGPRSARVEEVERTDLTGEPRYEGFAIAWRAPE